LLRDTRLQPKVVKTEGNRRELSVAWRRTLHAGVSSIVFGYSGGFSVISLMPRWV